MPELNIKLTIDGKEANATLDVTKEQLEEIITKLKDVPKNPPVTPAMAGSVAELKEKLKTLTKEYEGVTVGSQRFKELDVEINNVKGQLDDVYKKNQNVNKTPPITPAAVGTVAALKEKLQSLTKEYESVQIGSQRFKELDAEIKKTKSDLEDIYKEKPAAPAESSITKIGMAITGLNQGLELARKGFEVLSKPLEKAGQFEQYETALKVMLGSTDAAQARLAELVEFAKTTPFELPQVVSAANQLQALGKYSKDNLTMLGDLASASGKPMEQALSAYAKMMTGQKGIAIDMFRDLLVTADDWTKATGKKIGKNGELQASVEEMAAALPKIIKEKGFSGMMDAQSQTLLGMTSNFQDAFGQLQTKIGNMLMPVAKDILNMLTPALSGLQNNLGLVITTAEIGAVTFVTYEVAVNGATVATKVMEAASINLKKALDAVKLAMTSNPFAATATVVVGLGVALYELNKEYGNTYENQLKTQEAQKALNLEQQKSIQQQINLKAKTADVAKTYQELYTQYQNVNTKASERQVIEGKLHAILVSQQSIYPDLISNTYNYSEGLKAIKTASAQAVNDVKNLTGQLNEQQRSLANIELATAQIQAGKAIDDIISKTKHADTRYEEFYFEGIAEQIRNGSKTISQVLPELQKKQSQYSQWAAQTTSSLSKAWNVGMAQDLQNYISFLERIRDLNKVAQSGKGLGGDNASNAPAPVVKQDKAYWEGEKTKAQTELDALTEIEAKGKAGAVIRKRIEEINNKLKVYDASGKGAKKEEQNRQKNIDETKKYNAKIAEEEKARAMEYIDIQQALLDENAKLNEIHIKGNGKLTESDRHNLEIEKDITEENIKILEAEGKKREEEFSKQMDAWRKGEDNKFKAKEENLKKEKEFSKEASELWAETYKTDRERRLAELDNWHKEELEKFAGHEDVLLVIEKLYNKRKHDIEVETFREEHKIEAAAMDGLLAGFQTAWEQLLIVNRQAKDEWDAIWLSMENTALKSIENVVQKYIESGIIDLVDSIGKGGKGKESKDDSGSGGGFWGFLGGAVSFIGSLFGFATGGLVSGKEKIIKINEEGPEFVVNHNATMRNLPLLQDLNSGKDLSSTTTFNQILSDMTAVKMAADTSKAALRLDTGAYSDREIIKGIKELKAVMKEVADRPALAYISERDYQKAYYQAKAKEKKSTL